MPDWDLEEGHVIVDAILDGDGNPVTPGTIDAEKGAGPVTADTLRVITASDGPLNTAVGTKADAAWSGSGDGTIVSILKKIATLVSSVLKPATSGGLSSHSVVSAATTNATSVKASAGQLYGWYIGNNAASVRYVKIYDKASAPNPASDTPKLRLAIPALGGANVFTDVGIPFANGIAYVIVGGSGDTDATAVAAADVLLNLLYF